MNPVTLNPAALETFYESSDNCKELIRLVELDLNQAENYDSSEAELHRVLIKLCIETLLKFGLSSRELAAFDVLNSLGEDNSQQIRDALSVIYFDIDEIGMTLLKAHADTMKLLVCSFLLYMRASSSRNSVDEMHAEYKELAAS